MRLRQVLTIVLATALLLLTGTAALLISKLVHLEEYRSEIVTQVEKSLGRRVFFEQGEFSVRFGPSFTFTKLAVREKDGVANFITADRLTFKIAIIPLLRQNLVLKDLVLENPDISLVRFPEGFNVSDLLRQQGGPGTLDVKSVRLKKATIRFTDLAVVPEGLTTTLKDVDLAIDHLGRNRKNGIKLSAVIAETRSTIALSGSMRIAAEAPLAESFIDLGVSAKNLDAGRYWPYFRQYVPFRQILGKLEIDSKFRGKLSSFTSKGAVSVNGLRFDYPKIFNAVLTPRKMHFKYDFELAPHDVLVKSLDLSVDDLNVTGSCSIRNIHSGDPRITAQARTSQFLLERFAGYIPYGIIVDDVANYIKEHIKGGIFKLDEGRLDGLVSQIAHMEKGTNYNVLHIAGRVENGIVSYGPGIPAFNSIQGYLEMKGKDFILHDMKGKFGASPFSLEGKIADYPVDTPSSYPFSMTINPRQQEATWLFGWAGAARPNIAGDSQLHLSGSGTTGSYHLSGQWDLTPASVIVPGIASKPAGRAANISFQSTLNQQEMRFPSLRINLAPLVVNSSGLYRFSEPESLVIDASAGFTDMTQVGPMLLFLKNHKLNGNVKASIHGEGAGGNLAAMSWSGSILASNLAWHGPDQEKPVTGITGTVNFQGDRLETSRLTGKRGNSVFTVRGTVDGFQKPVAAVSFDSPRIDPADFGYNSPQQGIRITKVHGDILLKEQSLLIKTGRARVNNTELEIAGTVKNQSDADLTVTAPDLDLKDLMMLSTLEKSAGVTSRVPVSMKASLSAATAHYDDVTMTRLASVLVQKDKAFSMESMDCLLFGGRMTANGMADFSTPAPRYQIAFGIEKASAEQVLKTLGIKKQELTGLLSLKGEIAARGSDSTEIKKTATGAVTLHCENGTLRKFSVLSKVFSILNISQLLKFKLPDMVSGGMPYNDLTGNFSIRDGSISTSDFFISGNALNISAVGKIDILRNEIDATIGVQPLQSIDKAVSTIPIVGWILTGKDRNLITAYFEAKGKTIDPKVSAIPVKSMTKGVLNIFKRLFQLPMKLMTDTGEVILGK